MTHATGFDHPGENFFPFNEGVAVYLAGGHYKPEPLAERAGALFQLGRYVPIIDPGSGAFAPPQWEVAYLERAAVVTYLVETYGWETFDRVRTYPVDDQSSWLSSMLDELLNTTPRAFEQQFNAWMAAQTPGEQTRDLQLTLELQKLRRIYQDEFALFPYFVFGSEQGGALDLELPVLVYTDEPATTFHVAMECMLHEAQIAIVEQRYDRAERLIGSIAGVIATGEFSDPYAAQVYAIAELLLADGAEPVEIVVDGNQAQAVVIRNPPVPLPVSLTRTEAGWVVEGY